MAAWDLEQLELREKYAEQLRAIRARDYNSVATQIENLENTLVRWIELGIQLYQTLHIAQFLLQDPEDRDPKVLEANSHYIEGYEEKIEFAISNAINNLATLNIEVDLDARQNRQVDETN